MAVLLYVVITNAGRQRSLTKIFLSLGLIVSVGVAAVVALLTMSMEVMVRPDFTKETTIYARILIWARALDVAAYGSRLGVGGNQSDFYMASATFENSPLLASVGDQMEGLEAVQHFSSSIENIRASQQYLSAHSSVLDLVIDFGLIGIVLVWWMYKYPIMILGKHIKLPYSRDRLALLITAVFLVSFQLRVLFDSASRRLISIIAIFYSYILYLDNRVLRGK